MPPNELVDGCDISTVAHVRRVPLLNRYISGPVAVGLMLAAVLGTWWIATFTRHAHPVEPLNLAVTDLDFGRVWEDRAFPWRIEIQNNYGYALREIEFSASCDCTQIEPRSLSLDAGGKATIHVTIDLARPRIRRYKVPSRASKAGDSADDRSPALEDEFAAEIKARCKGVHGGWLPVQTWRLTGISRAAISVEPDAVSFGDSLIEGQPFPHRTVRMHAYVPLNRLAANADSGIVGIQVGAPAENGNDREILIQPKAGLAVGAHRCEVLIHAETADGESLPATRFPVELRVLDDVGATPAALNFGACPRGTTMSETLVIQSRSGVAIDVDCQDPESAEVSVESVRSERSFKQFRVTLQAIDAGERTTALRFIVRRPGEGDLIIPVIIRYLGTDD